MVLLIKHDIKFSHTIQVPIPKIENSAGQFLLGEGRVASGRRQD